MDGNVSLLLAPLHRDGVEHIVSAPRWAPPSDAEGYWHIPRSISAEEYGSGRVLFWCGGERDMPLDHLTNHAPVGVRCGTCVGRAGGFERRDSLIFQPRSAFDPPSVCPALVGDADVCRLCGGKPRHRRSYCHYDEVHHRPGQLLATYEPCLRHGWKRFVEECTRHYNAEGFPAIRYTGRVVCSTDSWQTRNDCGYVLFGADAAYDAAWTAALCVQQRRRRWPSTIRRKSPTDDERNP